VLSGAKAEASLLDVRNLTKSFSVGGLFSLKQIHAVQDVSFQIARRQVVSLVGESGSGKSTVARLIARLEAPTKGRIFFKGRNVLEIEPSKASLGYRGEVQMIFQDPFGSLNAVYTVGHHLARPLLIHKKVHGRSELSDQVTSLLEAVGLYPAREFVDKHPHQLSGGQRQRVSIARALAVDPELILADEPTSMLDVSIRMDVLNLIERLKEQRGIAYLYITHDIASARYIGDQTLVLYAGHLVEGADSEDLIRSPAHPYTQLLLSAVPDPHTGLKAGTIRVRSEFHSAPDPASGCPFAARCPSAMSVCREVMPGVTQLGSRHWVRCHLFGPGGAEAAHQSPGRADG